MLAHQQRFGFAVTGLLLQVGADRRTPVVPHKTRRVESELAPALLQAPADVHIVAGLAKNRIEPAYLLQRPSEERHVAAGNVLGLAVA